MPLITWSRRPRYLIRDRDRAYGRDFVARTKRIGIETVLTPVRRGGAKLGPVRA